jgi:chromate transporter
MNLKRKLLQLFWVFFKIGLFTFGGGFAMIPLIEREIVEKKKWISSEEICDILAISQSFPGAVAINSATIVGFRIAGYTGAFFATLGVILPSFIIITLIASFFTYIIDLKVAVAVLSAIGAGVIALLIVAAIRYGRAIIRYKLSILITVSALLILFFTDIHPVYSIIFGVGTGLLYYVIRLIREKLK